MKIVSACLLGVRCRYDDKSKPDNKAIKFLKKETLIPVCPEQLGGLPTPRSPNQIYGGTGKDVLKGKAKVINRAGKDVTKQFIKGARETLKIAKRFKIKEFIAKARSPSCSCTKIYHGRKLIKGDGVTIALLKKNGIKVISEENIK